MHLKFFFTLLSFLMLTEGGGAADDDQQNDPPKADDTDDQPEDVSGLKSALEKERTKRKQYETDLKAAREAQTELDRLKAEAQQKAEEDAAEQGRWQELAEGHKAELATVTTERDALQERLDKALAAITASIDAAWRAAPEEVRDLYEGDAEDALAKQTFLNKPATQKLIQRIAATNNGGNRPDPKSKPAPTKIDLSAIRKFG